MIKTVKRILLMAGDHCHKVTAGIGISLLYSIFSAMDLFAILYIAFFFFVLTMQKIVVIVGILLVGLIGKIVCKYQISKRISGSSYDVFYERRLEAGERLKKAPMGYYSEKNLGEIQMTLTTDMNALESSAMSVVENILGSLIYAAICTLVLLLFNWCRESNANALSCTGGNDRKNAGICSRQHGYATFWNRARWSKPSKGGFSEKAKS